MPVNENSMKQLCSHRCVKAYVSMQETSLIGTIKDFVECVSTIETNPQVLQQFYDYLKLKYKVPCETGMLFIEKITMLNIFDKFKIRVDHANSLVNRKMMLYQWIKPAHLEIQELNFGDVIQSLRKIGTTEVPSVKIYHLMKSIKLLYEKIGTSVGHDGFFPHLVYCFVKSEIKDLYAHIFLMKLCRRNFDQKCGFGCNHGFQTSVSCDCLFSENWRNEDGYYITTSLAAIDYISKIEFYNLKVDMAEFDKEITKRLKKVDLKNSIDDGSSVDMH